MAFSVRIFGHKGIVQTPIRNAHQYNSDSVFMLTQPYLWAQNLNVSAAPQSSAIIPSDMAALILVEIPLGSAIRYEINNATRNVAASANSPILTETSRLYWGQGWTISIMDAAGT